jgi:hypothetical protein
VTPKAAQLADRPVGDLFISIDRKHPLLQGHSTYSPQAGIIMRKFQPVRLAGRTLAAATTAAALLTGVSAHAATLNVPSSTSEDNTESARTSRPISVSEIRTALERQLGGSPAPIACWSNVSFRSRANGRYVSAEIDYSGGYNGMLRARATAVLPWERYTVCRTSSTGATLIFSPANRRYVSAELGYSGGYNGMLRARATVAGSWEVFITSAASGGGLWIRSRANGRYVSAELGYGGGYNGMLRARATAVLPWEVFTW